MDMENDHAAQNEQSALTTQTKRRRTTDADWDRHKPKLRRLWLEEKLTKAEIMKRMADEEDFHITEKQLKHRFEVKWKLSKNKRRIEQPTPTINTLGCRQGTGIGNKQTPPLLVCSSDYMLSDNAQLHSHGAFPGFILDESDDFLGLELNVDTQLHPYMLQDTNNYTATTQSAELLATIPNATSLSPATSNLKGVPMQTGPQVASSLQPSLQLTSSVCWNGLPGIENFGYSSFLRDQSQTLGVDSNRDGMPEPSSSRSYVQQDMVFIGNSIERAIPLLQAIEDAVHGFSKVLDKYCDHQLKTYESVQGKHLQTKLHQVMTWVYERSHEFRLRACPSRGQVEGPSTLDESRGFRTDAPYVFDPSQPKLSKEYKAIHGYSTLCHPGNLGGYVTVQYRRGQCQSFLGQPTAHDAAIVTYVPAYQGSKTAISITIPLLTQSSQLLSIPPIIQTFNIIPDDADVLLCIERGDTEGFKQLLQNNTAHFMDITAAGDTLLCYAIQGGFTEIFQILANHMPDGNINRSRGQHVVEYIWDTWIDKSDAVDNVPLGDIGQCIQMTRYVSNIQCDIDDFVTPNPYTPTLLFLLYAGSTRRCEGQPTAEAIELMLSAGIDLEERNIVRQTPLLYSSFHSTPNSVRTIEALLLHHADVDATDIHGRGPLHSALFQKSFVKWPTCILPPRYDKFGSLKQYCMRCHYCQRVRRSEEVTEKTEKIELGKTEQTDRSRCLRDCDHDVGYATNCSNEQSADQDNVYDNYGNITDDNDGERKESFAPATVEFGADHGSGANFELSWRHEFTWYKALVSAHREWRYDPGWPAKLLHVSCRVSLLLKLCTLLSHGCDPNKLDNQDLSPSDYARSNSLWFVWEQALHQSGWYFDESESCCRRLCSHSAREWQEEEDEEDSEDDQNYEDSEANEDEVSPGLNIPSDAGRDFEAEFEKAQDLNTETENTKDGSINLDEMEVLDVIPANEYPELSGDEGRWVVDNTEL